MQNYYEVLEVNENASKEVIEKAYKVLIKKYHPDLQQDVTKKKEAENKVKQLNEAYEILSDELKKQQYDNKLKKYNEQKKEAGLQYARNIVNNVNTNNEVEKKVKEAYQKAYKRAYEEYEREYKQNIKRHFTEVYVNKNNQYKKNKNYTQTKFYQFIKNWFIILVLVCILSVVLVLPITQNYLQNIYETNKIAAIFLDLINKIVTVFVNPDRVLF